jgi:exonuclease III
MFMDLIHPINRHCLANWIRKEDPTICCLQEIHLIDRNKHWLHVKGWKIYQANDPPKQAGVAILILDKVDFKLTLIRQDKEGDSILIKGKYTKRKQQLSHYMHPTSMHQISSNIL